MRRLCEVRRPMAVLRMVAVWLMVAAMSPANAFETKGWQWKRPLELSEAAEFAQIRIPPEVFDASQPSLNDLRVLDKSGNMARHAVLWGRAQDSEQLQWRGAKLINPTFEPDKFSRVVIDFGSVVEKNVVRVGLSGENYRRKVLVEGSSDSTTWERLVENLYLFDISLPGKQFKVNELALPTNNFRYLRLTVFNMPDDPRQIGIESVVTAKREIVAQQTTTLVARLVASREDTERKTSIREYDLGLRNLPVSALHFGVEDRFFHRGFDLAGRNSTTQTLRIRSESGTVKREAETPWSNAGSGVIYRMGEDRNVTENLRAELAAPYRYLRLTVYNGDNPMLRMGETSASLREVRVAFDAAAGRQFALIGGNPDASAPSFDIAQSVGDLERRVLPDAKLGKATALDAAKELAPWTERHAALIWIALIAGTICMLFLILSNLRHGQGMTAGKSAPEQSDSEKPGE